MHLNRLLGLSSKSEKNLSLKSSLSISDEGYLEKYGSDESLEESELVEIGGTSKIEVENAKLKAELASKVALICSMSAELDYESFDERELDSVLKNAVEKTSEALNLKDEYEKHLQSMLKVKQKQCESYEKRIQELEQKLSGGEDESKLMISTTKTDDNKSEVLCGSNTSKSGILTEHDNMTDSSSMLNSQLDSSMLDLHHVKGNLYDKDKMTMPQPDSGTSIISSNMSVSINPDLDAKGNGGIVVELQNAIAEKSSQLKNAEAKILALMDEVSGLERDLAVGQKLLDESQMNSAHLEKCLHEAREEAQTRFCAVDRRASEYNTLCKSAIKTCDLFERLRNCVSSHEEATAFADSLHALAQSLSSSLSEDDDYSTTEFRDCIQTLSNKVGLLSRQRAEFLERSSEAEAANKQLFKELEEKKELINTLYLEHHLEKQANKEKICLGPLEVHELAAFVLNSSGHYEAITCSCHRYFLSSESIALFSDHTSRNQNYILGQVVHIEREVVMPPPLSTPDEGKNESGSKETTLDQDRGSTPLYGLPFGCEYFVVTVAMLPEIGVRSTLS